MKVDKIARLFAAQSEPALVSQSQSNSVAAAGANEPGAVRVSADLQGSSAAEGSARSARLAQLKAQVESGSYNPDREKVASAVLQELFA